jgi:hypothetical protein
LAYTDWARLFDAEARASCDIRIRGTYLYAGRYRRTLELLCKLAAKEQDPEKLLELAAAIDRLLEEKQERLEQLRRGTEKDGTTAQKPYCVHRRGRQ